MTLNLGKTFQPLFVIHGKRGFGGHSYDKQKLASGKVTEVISAIVSIRSNKIAVVKNAADDNHNDVRVCVLFHENVSRIFDVPADARQENGRCTISRNAKERVAIIFEIVFHVEVGNEGGMKCRERGVAFL